MLNCLILDAGQAASVQEETADSENRLRPILIIGGDYAGSYALPARVLDDPAFADFHDTLVAFPQVELDPEVAWPPEPDE